MGGHYLIMEKYEKLNEAFGKRVKALRAQEGHSQEAFAQEAGIDRSYYGRIERGEANPTLKNIAAIANVLGISITELFEELPKAGRRKSNS
jgi:transcriptional regulator with XRE-family HTH domain